MKFLTLICPNLKCRKTLQVPDNIRGQVVKCRNCQMSFAVPALAQPAVAKAK